MKVKKKSFLFFFLPLIILSLVFLGGIIFYNIPFILFWEINDLNSRIDQYEVVGNINVLHYDLDITLLPETKEIKGNATIKILPHNYESSTFELNFYDNMMIYKCTVNGINTEYEHDDNILLIKLSESIQDTLIVNIIYQGEPKKVGLGSFNFDEYRGSSFIYSLNEPIYASTWFPCNDTPGDKSTADVKITNDSSMVSLSNGVLIDVYKTGKQSTYHWRTHYPIATYLIAIYSAEYQHFRQRYISITKQDTMNIDYYVTEDKLTEAKIDFEKHPLIIKTLAELFGEYPFIKEKYSIAQFLWPYGAMEHQTITGVGVNFISGKNFYFDVLVHEAAHQWWGNAVTPKSWKDIWLNEGFSSYSEALYWEKVSGKDALISTMLSKLGEFDKTTLYNPQGNIFNETVYDKGAWVLHMLRREIGDSCFFDLLKRYFDNYKYQNAGTNNLLELAQDLSGKNLSKFFDQWIYNGIGKIKLNAEWILIDSSGYDYRVELKLKQVQDLYECYNFPVDILIEDINQNKRIGQYYITSRDTSFTIRAEEYPTTIIIDPGKWLLADITYLSKK